MKASTEKTEASVRESHNLVVMWECEWHKLRKDPVIANVVKDFDIQERLKPRDALYGGEYYS